MESWTLDETIGDQIPCTQFKAHQVWNKDTEADSDLEVSY